MRVLSIVAGLVLGVAVAGLVLGGILAFAPDPVVPARPVPSLAAESATPEANPSASPSASAGASPSASPAVNVSS